MDYGMIGKREKAHRYAEERERFDFKQFEVTVKGENSDHTVSFKEGKWQCDCSFFQTRGACSHTMALEMILDKMISEEE
ncbi:MAG: SWIM zinc finger family protein [Anaerolineaceae bacterium]|nr:SWIM zinc finger family protein [Anaerolineaceae bacterium]